MKNEHNNNVDSTSLTAERSSTSTTQQQHKISGVFNTPSDNNGFRLIDIDILKSVFVNYTSCKNCENKTLDLIERIEYKKGMSHNLQLFCTSCDFTYEFYTSGRLKTM